MNGSYDIVRNAIRREAERSRGIIPGFLRMSSTRTSDISIPAIANLPVLIGESDPIQDADGNTFFRFGYSAFGGGHVLK